MLDSDVIAALEAMRRHYDAERLGRTPPGMRLSDQANKVLQAAKQMCEVRLGRMGGPLELSVEPISLEEIIECLKRLEKSARHWNKEAGRRGYIQFVSQFMG